METQYNSVDRGKALRAGVRERVPYRQAEPEAHAGRRAREIQDGAVEDEGIGHKARRTADPVRRRTAHLQVQDVARIRRVENVCGRGGHRGRRRAGQLGALRI